MENANCKHELSFTHPDTIVTEKCYSAGGVKIHLEVYLSL